MLTQILNTFPEVAERGCLVFNQEVEMGVIDDEPCRFANLEEEAHLIVKNSNTQTINLLKIDYCLFGSQERRRSDCALFNETAFYFVEIKKVRKAKQRSEAKDEAIIQLRNSITHFRDQGVDFQNHDLKAVICCTFKQVYPMRTSSKADAVVEFQNELNALLVEGNSIDF